MWGCRSGPIRFEMNELDSAARVVADVLEQIKVNVEEFGQRLDVGLDEGETQCQRVRTGPGLRST